MGKRNFMPLFCILLLCLCFTACDESLSQKGSLESIRKINPSSLVSQKTCENHRLEALNSGLISNSEYEKYKANKTAPLFYENKHTADVFCN